MLNQWLALPAILTDGVINSRDIGLIAAGTFIVTGILAFWKGAEWIHQLRQRRSQWRPLRPMIYRLNRIKKAPCEAMVLTI